MHELALTQGIIEMAERTAREHGSPSVTRIKLRIGEFTGVVKEAIEFAFSVLKDETLAASAELEIEVVPFRKLCRSCEESFPGSGVMDMLCPRCSAPAQIVSGRELQVEYVDLA